jgi:hypothetical protein
MKLKAKFSLGYNAGLRHVGLSMAPRDFTLNDKTDDYKAGYRFGIRDRRAGIISDEKAAQGAYEMAWRSYAAGGDVPNVRL